MLRSRATRARREDCRRILARRSLSTASQRSPERECTSFRSLSMMDVRSVSSASSVLRLSPVAGLLAFSFRTKRPARTGLLPPRGGRTGGREEKEKDFLRGVGSASALIQSKTKYLNVFGGHYPSPLSTTLQDGTRPAVGRCGSGFQVLMDVWTALTNCRTVGCRPPDCG